MATGVKPRDDDCQLTKSDLENIKDAMREKKFRDLLADYCEEVSDPANQALYQKEMTQLEKERGYDVTFINPKGGYVIKTSVAGDRKAFINICSNDNVDKPSCRVQIVDGKKGMNWQVPYTLIPPREDFDSKRQRCVIYDVVFHPDTLRMANQNKEFRQLVNNTAFDALKRSYDIHLDNNNIRFPKSFYKGTAVHAVIRKEDPNYQPPTDEDNEDIPPEVLEKLYPQHSFEQPKEPPKQEHNIKRSKTVRTEFSHNSDKGYTVPKFIIKQQKNVDFQDYTYDKDCKQHSAIPSQIVVEINLPLLSSTKDCILDVQERKLSLVSEKSAKYKLCITLPYAVNYQAGSAKFDKLKHMLLVTLPVIRKYEFSQHANSLRVDSGVESEENSGQSDEDKDNLIEELSSIPSNVTVVEQQKVCEIKPESFLNPNLGYILPPYTQNALDDTVAFTFHVKNTEPESVMVKQDGNKIFFKFTSVGSGFVPVHYAVLICFDESATFDDVTAEAWDNNVILQMAVTGNMPEKFQIGLNEESLISDHFDVSPQTMIQKVKFGETSEVKATEENPSPVIAVTNLGTETNIVVTSNDILEEDSSSSLIEKEIIWTEGTHNVSSAKSILRKSMGRSFSESSMGDVASSMDYISSDCIPEESSLKKTVRFSNVIAKQVYRVNSSIEGQKKKNQRKKSKKRTQEQRKSESEAEDEQLIDDNKSSKAKSSLKQRRDSGLADTSDADTDCKNSPDKGHNFNQDKKSNKTLLDIVDNNISNEEPPAIWESENETAKQDSNNKKAPKITCDSIKHKTDFYDPEKLNHGQYTEVKFKNDLIFDLDM